MCTINIRDEDEGMLQHFLTPTIFHSNLGTGRMAKTNYTHGLNPNIISTN